MSAWSCIQLVLTDGATGPIIWIFYWYKCVFLVSPILESAHDEISQTTNAVFLGTPPPVGFGFSTDVISGLYATPIVAVMCGELFGRFTNDWIMNTSVKRNNGVFEAESRLWYVQDRNISGDRYTIANFAGVRACYAAVPLYICGFVLLGAAFEKHLGTAAIIFGWGIAVMAVMINTVAVCEWYFCYIRYKNRLTVTADAYCNDCFPKHKGEVSALVNLTRTLGGAYCFIPHLSYRLIMNPYQDLLLHTFRSLGLRKMVRCRHSELKLR